MQSLVGKVKNKKFAFFWLLIGGSIGNLILILYFPDIWPMFLPSAILPILIAIMMANKMQRPKIWLGAELLLTAAPLILLAPFVGSGHGQINLVMFFPDILIIFGCTLGIMDW